MLRYLKIFILFVLTAQLSMGQKLVNSPYSRFGPGTLEPVGSFKSLSMGLTGISHRDPLNLNFQNPASYTSIDTNSFVFDFGIDYRIIGLESGDESYQSDDMNFHHIIMGFPIGKKLGFVTGITPYSSGYYNISFVVDDEHPNYDPLIGETQEVHKGVGGYNKFFFGLGYKPLTGLSVGANMTFLFGNVDRSNTYNFVDDANMFSNLTTEAVQMSGYNIDFGLQYMHEFKNEMFATAGLTYSRTAKYKGETEKLVALYSKTYSGSTFSIDTLEYLGTEDDNLKLPGQMGFGLTLGKKNNYSLSAEYTMTPWSEAVFLGHESYFADSKSFNFGAEYIPNYSANYNFLNRVAYRLGGHITDSHLVLGGEQLKEFGITFGAGIPLRRSYNRINVYFEYGNRTGNLDLGLHKETFYNFGLSFNFYDNWFMKRKYD